MAPSSWWERSGTEHIPDGLGGRATGDRASSPSSWGPEHFGKSAGAELPGTEHFSERNDRNAEILGTEHIPDGLGVSSRGRLSNFAGLTDRHTYDPIVGE